MINDLALAGYRSFGEKPQYLEGFKKINVFIGRNNSGKSNVLRFLSEVYPRIAGNDVLMLAPLDRHLPDQPAFRFGVPYKFSVAVDGTATLGEPWHSTLEKDERSHLSRILAALFQAKSDLDGTPNAAWMFVDERGMQISSDWQGAFDKLSENDLYNLWHGLNRNSSGGDRKTWMTQTLTLLQPRFSVERSELIPAIRQIGVKSSAIEGYGGSGIIEKLSMLESPGVLNQAERTKFDKINSFLANVTENSSARITVPFDRDTILVHMDGKVLPLESLGSGLHEVIILAVASTLLENHVVCMEEPELHLNPVLQKKLIRYLTTATNNQYFISTHSSSFIDAPEAAVFHVKQVEFSSRVTKVSSNDDRSNICQDLGYHPSDLLQANCIIWVEGPSDRLYVNWWIAAVDKDLIEGVHYSVMFYGGRLLAHLSNNDIDELVDDFISLRRLNRRGAILIDSDRENPQSGLNATKKRLNHEFGNESGFAWITAGREMENYLDPKLIAEAIPVVHKTAKPQTNFGKYENCLLVKKPRSGIGQVSKVEVAKWIVQHPARLNFHDLQKKVEQLVEFIYKSNPGS